MDFAGNQDLTYLDPPVYVEPLNLLQAVYKDHPKCGESLNQWCYIHTCISFIVDHSIMEKFDRRSTYQYKLRESKLDELKKLGALLIDNHRDAFKKTYSNMLAILLTKEDTALILTFSQLYDLILHYFTFQDFLLAHTLEEFAHLLCIPVKDQVPYMSTYGFPESAVIAQDLHFNREVVDSNIRTKGNTRGFPSKFLIEKATLFADSGRWDAFYVNFSISSMVLYFSRILKVSLIKLLSTSSRPRIWFPRF